jgi:hypothetical protein
MAKASSLTAKLISTAISILLIFSLIGIGEIYCRYFTRINFLDNSRGLFTYKRFGEAFGNTPNFEGISFGEKVYIDGEGFRYDPNFRSNVPADAPALLLVGDSVAFGTGLTDDKTIAGNLRGWMPTTKVLNTSTIGYDTFAYKAAVQDRVANHPEIKTVAIVFCLNDVIDASAQLIRSQNGQETEGEPDPNRSVVRKANDYLRSRSKLFLWLKNVLIDTQMQYFQFDLEAYKKGDDNVAAVLQPIVELNGELKAKGITLKVFISPYEAQLRPDLIADAHLPQKMLTNILTKNGIENYDMMPDFAASPMDEKLLFLYNDPMHLSAEGNEIVAKDICRKIEGCNAN